MIPRSARLMSLLPLLFPTFGLLLGCGGEMQILSSVAGASSVASGAPVVGADPEALRFALVVGDRLLLSTRPDESWAIGPPRQEAGAPPDGTMMGRAVDPGKLPKGLRHLAGQRVQVFGETGVLCEATVLPPRLVGLFFGAPAKEDLPDGLPGRPVAATPMITTDDGPVQRFRLPPDFSGAPREVEVTANTLWDWAAGRALLAELRYDTAGCEPPAQTKEQNPYAPAPLRWARAQSLPVPVLAAPQEPAPSLVSLALSQQRSLPTYAEIQEEYVSWHKEAGLYAQEANLDAPPPAVRWDDQSGAPDMKLFRLAHAGQPVTLLLLRAAGADKREIVCGMTERFESDLWTLWDVGGEPGAPRLTLRAQGRGMPAIESMVDEDQSGEVRLLYHGEYGPGMLHPAGEVPYEIGEELSGTNFDAFCPC